MNNKGIIIENERKYDDNQKQIEDIKNLIINRPKDEDLLKNKDIMNMALLLEKTAFKKVSINRNIYIEPFFNVKNIIHKNCEHNTQLNRIQKDDDNYIEALCFCYE